MKFSAESCRLLFFSRGLVLVSVDLAFSVLVRFLIPVSVPKHGDIFGNRQVFVNSSELCFVSNEVVSPPPLPAKLQDWIDLRQRQSPTIRRLPLGAGILAKSGHPSRAIRVSFRLHAKRKAMNKALSLLGLVALVLAALSCFALASSEADVVPMLAWSSAEYVPLVLASFGVRVLISSM